VNSPHHTIHVHNMNASNGLIRYMTRVYNYVLMDYYTLHSVPVRDRFSPMKYPSLLKDKVTDMIKLFKETIADALLTASMKYFSSNRETKYLDIYTKQMYSWDCGLACCAMALKYMDMKLDSDSLYSHPLVKSSPLWTIDLYGTLLIIIH